MEYLQRENVYLNQRIEFLEKVIESHIEINLKLDDTNQKLFKQIEEMEKKENKEVVTYFSPFTGEPVLVETETHKYMVDVNRILFKDDK